MDGRTVGRTDGMNPNTHIHNTFALVATVVFTLLDVVQHEEYQQYRIAVWLRLLSISASETKHSKLD